MATNRKVIKAMVRQFLRDEFTSEELLDFKDEELDRHTDHCRVDVSQESPYEDRETVSGNGTKELDISSIEGLIGEKVEKVEYPVDSDPPEDCKFSIFGNILRLHIDSAPPSGKNVYLYCQKVHQLTDSASTLSAELEKVLVDGVVAKAAQSWCAEQMRKDIIPASLKLHQNWADKQFIIYQNSLNSITKPRAWEY